MNYIENLHIKDFRLFKEVDVKFNKRFNFIVGPNGCGKTSLLRAIILSYSYTDLYDSRYGNNFEVWADIFIDDRKVRMGIKQDSNQNILKTYRSNPNLKIVQIPQNDVISDNIFSFNNKIFAPLVLGAYRRIEYKKIDGMKRENVKDQSINDYINLATKSLNGGYLPDVKQWMINRYFEIEKEWAKIEKENWNWLIENICNIGHNNNFKFVKIGRDLEPIFSLNDLECYLEELSSGFQSLLSIILAIFEWIEKTNTNDKMLVKKAEGTVIIDEIDAHLHPEWQLEIRGILDNIFPELQFIMTTHSPHIIASAEKGEVLIMDKNNDFLERKLYPSEKAYFGWNTDSILEDIMKVNNLENQHYNLLIKVALEYYQQKNYKELEKLVKELESICHRNDPIVLSLKIKLAALGLGEVDD